MENLFSLEETTDLPFKLKTKRHRPDLLGDKIIDLLKESRDTYHLKHVSLEQIRVALYRKYKMEKTYTHIAVKMETLASKGKVERIGHGLYTAKKGDVL